MVQILVIDDQEQLLTDLVELLEFAGYTVQGATTGQEGVSLAQQLHPDLILCDVMMPGFDGFQVLEAIRADESTASIPVIFVSAKSDGETITRSKAMGVDAYIQKPFELDALIATIRSFFK